MKITYNEIENKIIEFMKKYIEFHHEKFDPIVLFNYCYHEIQIENENYKLIDVLNEIIELINLTIKKYELNVDEFEKIDKLL